MRTGLIFAAGLAAMLAACGRGPTPRPIDESQSMQPALVQPAAQPVPDQPAAQQGAGDAQPYVQPAQDGAAVPQQARSQGPEPMQPQAQEPAQAQPQEATMARPSPTMGQQGIAQQPQTLAPQAAGGAVSIPAGTALRVRLEQTIGTRLNRPGDRFDATLVEPVVVGGRTLIPAGTAFHGHVMESKKSGRFKGRAVLGVELDSFHMNGRRYSVLTAADFRESGRHKKRNWVMIGGGTGLGTALGAVAGGPAGALIGAGAGAAVGTTGAYLTGKKNISLPAETALTFRLRRDVPVSFGGNPS